MESKIVEFLSDRNGKRYMWANSKGGETVQYNDYFNAKDVMSVMHDFFVEKGWASDSDPSFPEDFYHHIMRQGGSEEIRWRWRMQKKGGAIPGGDHNGFFKYRYNLDIRIIGMVKTEIMRHGMKFKTNKGDIEIKSEGLLFLDAAGEWKNHSILKNFLEVYVKRMKKGAVSQHLANINRDVLAFKNAMKNYMKLPIVTPERGAQAGWERTRDYD